LSIDTPWFAAFPLVLSGGWLVWAWISPRTSPPANSGVYFNPSTLVATVTAGISAGFVAHACLDSWRPGTGATVTSVNLYGMAAAALASGALTGVLVSRSGLLRSS